MIFSSQPSIFVKHYSDCTHTYSGFSMKEMLGFFIENICIIFGDQVVQQSFRNSHERKLCSIISWPTFVFLRGRNSSNPFTSKENSPAVTSISRCINHVLSINNTCFHPNVHLIYQSALYMKYTTESSISALYLDIIFDITRLRVDRNLRGCMLKHIRHCLGYNDAWRCRAHHFRLRFILLLQVFTCIPYVIFLQMARQLLSLP